MGTPKKPQKSARGAAIAKARAKHGDQASWPDIFRKLDKKSSTKKGK